MKRLRMLTSRAGEGFSQQYGDVLDVPRQISDTDARKLVATGGAEWIDEEQEVERAVITTPVETAAHVYNQTSKRRRRR